MTHFGRFAGYRKWHLGCPNQTSPKPKPKPLQNSRNLSKSHETSSCVVHHQHRMFHLMSWLSLRKSKQSRISKIFVKIMKPKFGQDFGSWVLLKLKIKMAHANCRWSYFSPFPNKTKMKFSIITSKNSTKFKDSMSLVCCAFGNVYFKSVMSKSCWFCLSGS